MKRKQTVTYKPGVGKQRPMIRLTNWFLVKFGFQVGDKIYVEYADGVIVITRKI